MILRNTSWEKFAEKVRANQHRIVVYGAGMIGKTVVPFWLEAYDLCDHVECYVDMDAGKTGRSIRIKGKEYGIYHPDRLKKRTDNLLLLITNTKFYSVLDYLDGIPVLDNVEGYIVPIMQIREFDDAEPVAFERLSDEPLIPKKIHYTWFSGDPMPDLLIRCVNSWKKYCPDYEIILWDKSNYDLTRIPFAKEASELGKYGTASDAARLDILYEHGGIYMDIDVELLRNPDELLYQPAFTGLERWGTINSGGMFGAVPGHPMVREILEDKKRCHFIEKDGSLNTDTNGVIETLPFIRHGMKINNRLQRISGVTVYPSGVFSPYNYMTGEDTVRSWTVSRHHFYGGWMDEDDKANRLRTQEKYRQVLARMDAPGKRFCTPSCHKEPGCRA